MSEKCVKHKKGTYSSSMRQYTWLYYAPGGLVEFSRRNAMSGITAGPAMASDNSGSPGIWLGRKAIDCGMI